MGDDDGKVDIDIIYDNTSYPLRVPIEITPNTLVEYLRIRKNVDIPATKKVTVYIELKFDQPLNKLLDTSVIKIVMKTESNIDGIEERKPSK